MVVDGISMAVTQRSEFTSAIERQGGQVQGLLATLHQQTPSALPQQGIWLRSWPSVFQL
jgi:phospholipid transport system substrate-binding protein